MIKFEKVEFMGMKDCISLTYGDSEMIVTTAAGPRIISLKKGGGKNHMVTFADHLSGKADKSNFLAYGGHRVWHAPEVGGRTNLPDNNACEYNIENNILNVMSKNDDTKLSSGFSITVGGDGALIVNNTILNQGLFDIELSVWGLTQFAVGGLLAVPNSVLDTGFVANRAVAMWPYSKMNDRRVYFGDKFITVLPDREKSAPFKFGATCDEQYACYFNHNQLVIKKFDYFFETDYPNYYCNFESYTNEDFIEIESLSPLFTLEPGEVGVHTEKIYIFDNIKCPDRFDEKAIEKTVNKALESIK